jgi:phosphoglycerate dehydrogenase-like enzyme
MRQGDAVNPKPIVIQTEHLSDEAAAWLGERCRLIVCAPDSEAFERAIADAAGLVVRTYTIVDGTLLARAPALRVVGRAGVGLDNIDVHACRARNIEVVYTPDANTQAVVEYVLAIMLDEIRPRIALDRAVEPATWNQLRQEIVGKRQLNELMLGILGLGRVGRRLAKVAGATGCRVLYNDFIPIQPSDRHGAQAVDVQSLFSKSDIVSVHIDGRPSNREFVNANLIGRMKPQALLINTSRGFVVDNLALAAWLTRHPSASALLDVHEPEPFPHDYPLLGVPNAKLYPHLASRTEAAMNAMSWVVKDVVAVLEGRKPEFTAP